MPKLYCLYPKPVLVATLVAAGRALIKKEAKDLRCCISSKTVVIASTLAAAFTTYLGKTPEDTRTQAVEQWAAQCGLQLIEGDLAMCTYCLQYGTRCNRCV